MADPNAAPFDPKANYVAAKNFRFAGYPVLKGAPIDATKLPEDQRERKLRLLYENRHIVVDDNPPAPRALTDAEQAKVKELVDGNSRDDLNDLADAAGIDDADKLPNKEAVAEAIVRADADDAAEANRA